MRPEAATKGGWKGGSEEVEKMEIRKKHENFVRFCACGEIIERKKIAENHHHKIDTKVMKIKCCNKSKKLKHCITKGHEKREAWKIGSQERAWRKKDNGHHPNEKFLGVQNPFYKKGFGRRRQKLAVDLGYLTLRISYIFEEFFFVFIRENRNFVLTKKFDKINATDIKYFSSHSRRNLSPFIQFDH